QGLSAAGADARRAAGPPRPEKVRRLFDAGGGDVARHLPYVQTAGPDEGQDARYHDPLLSRLPGGQHGTAVHGPPGPGRPRQLPGEDLRLRARHPMKTIGELLSRDLSHKIEEVIQVDQAEEHAVFTEIDEYIATDSIRDRYAHLLKAVAEAPSE